MRWIMVVLLAIYLAACERETLASMEPLEEMVDTTALFLAGGEFESGPYGKVTGIARVYKKYMGKYSIALDSFMTSNGPDLYVYLSRQVMPVDFIEAGKLKSTNGNQVYDLPGMPDLGQYKYIAIHCKRYNHLFGYALLK